MASGSIQAVRFVDPDGNDVDVGTSAGQAAILAALQSIGGGASTMTSGRKAVAVTDTAIVLGSAACKTIFITALTTNAGPIVIGGSGVVFSEATRTGKIMYPGDSITVSIDNLDSVYINGPAGDGVSFTYTT